MKTFSTILSNFIYLLQKLIRFDPKLLGNCLIMILVGLLIPISNVIFPKLVIWSVIQEAPSGSLF